MPAYTPDDVTLRVTAGPTHDAASHVEVQVNAPGPLRISSPLIDVELNVRIKNHRGLPRGSPKSSAYFAEKRQAEEQWLYGIAFGFTLKRPPEMDDDNDNDDDDDDDNSDGVRAADLQWGNDFDRPVRAHLPPGFNVAMRIAKWFIDPGLEGDMYADRPHLFGPVLSSMNTVYIGKPETTAEFGLRVDEGEDPSLASSSIRQKLGMPDNSAERARWAQRRDWSGCAPALENFTWAYDVPYGVDFGNGYLDFANYSVQLPGYSLGVLSVWDGQPFRYVLRNRRTGAVYFVVVFDLLVRKELNEDGTVKEGVRVRKGVRVREEDVLVDNLNGVEEGEAGGADEGEADVGDEEACRSGDDGDVD